MTGDPAGDPADIRGWQRLGPDLTTSGRLQPHDPGRLQAAGVRHVINLALDDHPEALANEAGLLAACGIAYTHIPIPFDQPEERHYQAFTQALAAAQGPVHVHCIMNWRVSALFYRHHRENGMGRADALQLMRQHWDPFASDDCKALAWARLVGAADQDES